MPDPSRFEPALRTRANDVCELCGADQALHAYAVEPSPALDVDRCALICATCRAQLDGDATVDANHWYCLQASAWSEVAAVKVLSYRMLSRLADQAWASELLEQIYLDDETLAWATAGAESGETEARPRTVDSNGVELADGDSVTLIKDLDVKGAGFTAKRGTVVKGIRLTDNPEHVEGRVNKVAIVLKTQFLKRV